MTAVLSRVAAFVNANGLLLLFVGVVVGPRGTLGPVKRLSLAAWTLLTSAFVVGALPSRASATSNLLPAGVRLVIEVDLGVLFEPEQVEAIIEGALLDTAPFVDTLSGDVRRVQRVTFLSFADGAATVADSGVFVIDGTFSTRRVHQALSTVAVDGLENLSVASLPNGSVAFGDPDAVRRVVSARLRPKASSKTDASVRRALAHMAAPDQHRRALVIAMRGFADFTGLAAAFHVNARTPKASTRSGSITLYGATSRAAARALATRTKALLAALAPRSSLEAMRDQLFGTLNAGALSTLVTDAAAELIASAKLTRPDRRSVRLEGRFDCSKLLAMFVSNMRLAASIARGQGGSETL